MENNYQSESEKLGMSRRFFIFKAVPAVTAIVASGCAYKYSPLDPNDKEAQDAMASWTKDTLGDTPENFIANSVKAFFKPQIAAIPDVPFHNFKDKFGPNAEALVGGLSYAASIGKSAGVALAGQPLVFNSTMAGMYESREALGKVKTYDMLAGMVNGIVGEVIRGSEDVVADTHRARVSLKATLEGMSAYKNVLAQLRDPKFTTGNSELDGKVKAVLNGAFQNAGQLQHYFRVMKAAYVGEGAFGDDLDQAITMDNDLHVFRGGQSFLKLGAKVLPRSVKDEDGKDCTLQMLLDEYLPDAKDHFAKQDPNYIQDVVEGCRFPVLRPAFHELLKKKQIGVDDHRGLVYVVDRKLIDASRTPVDAAYGIFRGALHWIPGVTAVDSFFNDWLYMNKADSPDEKSQAVTVVRQLLEGDAGATNYAWRPGSRNVVLNGLVALGFTIVEGLLIAAALKSGGGKHGNTSNGGGSVPPPGQTGTGGIIKK